MSSSFRYSNPFFCIYQTKFVPVRISASHAQPLQGRWWQNREHFLHRFTHLLYLSLEKLSNIHSFFFKIVNVFHWDHSTSCLLIIFFLSGMEPQLTLWARHLSNQSSACKVLGKNRKRKGRTNREGERGDRSTSAGFLLAKSLPCLPPPPCVEPFLSLCVISSSVSYSPTMITGSAVVCRNTQTSVTSFSSPNYSKLLDISRGCHCSTQSW